MYKILFFLSVIFLSTQCKCQQGIVSGIKVNARVMYFKGSSVELQNDLRFNKNTAALKVTKTLWNCNKTIRGNESVYTFELTKGKAENAGVAISFLFSDWSISNYIIMPSGAYNGNRFDVLKYSYAPLFQPKDYNKNLPVTITDVPRLNKYEGESRMDLNTGDLSTPAIGIYFPKTKKGIWILTQQATELGNSVLTFKENNNRTKAEFIIGAPCVREKIYGMTHLSSSNETGINFKQGEKVTIKYKIFTYDNLASPKDLNNRFLTIRKSYGTSDYVHQLPFSKAFELMEKQENEFWSPEDSVYTLGGGTINMHWQLGWVGGLMVTLPLSEIGGDSSKANAFKNYHKILTQTQAPSGFFYGCGDGKSWVSDCFSTVHPDNLHLLRKNADALYYVYKYYYTQKLKNPNWQVPEGWQSPMHKMAEAFVKLWNENGQWGQFIDIETGKIKVGGSNSAAMAIGGLALASQYENKPYWLQVAKAAARYYYKNFTLKGISCGGPGEILQNNDAESAFAMLESFVTLYEVTGENEWLRYAEDAAAFCSTWMVTYDYRFPSSSVFGKLDMKTTGAVWASTQNKHGGPGICTLSGDCLFKLYRATGNKLYLGMIYDVAHNIMQYIARKDRPIKDQHVGWINERVNLSDWEGKDNIGNIFHGNTWAQVSAMLIVAQVPGIYINPAKKEVIAFDHVMAKLSGEKLVITNPTRFDANVRVFIDNDPSKAYPQGFIAQCPMVQVKAGAIKEIALSKIK